MNVVLHKIGKSDRKWKFIVWNHKINKQVEAIMMLDAKIANWHVRFSYFSFFLPSFRYVLYLL